MNTLRTAPPRYPALERAMRHWGMVDPDPILEPPAILTRLRRVQTFCNGAAPVAVHEPRILTDPTYWRRRAREAGLDMGEPA